MTITVGATFENGVLRPKVPLDLAEGAEVQVTVQTPVEVPAALDAVERTYGLLKWSGDVETLDRIAMDPEFGIEEAR